MWCGFAGAVDPPSPRGLWESGRVDPHAAHTLSPSELSNVHALQAQPRPLWWWPSAATIKGPDSPVSVRLCALPSWARES